MKIFKTKKYSILSNILKYSFVIMFAVMLVAPIVFAATGPTTGTGASGPTTGTGTNITTTINNPLGDKITDLPSFIKQLLTIVVTIGVPIVALAIIYTGFLFVKAQGNPEKIKEAKQTLMYTLIGAALLLGAFVIAQAIGTTVKNISSGV